MPGDGIDVQEPEDEQRDGNQAHEGQRHEEEQSDGVQAVSPLPVATPPRLFEHRERLGRHSENRSYEGRRSAAVPKSKVQEVVSRSRRARAKPCLWAPPFAGRERNALRTSSARSRARVGLIEYSGVTPSAPLRLGLPRPLTLLPTMCAASAVKTVAATVR